VVLNLEERDVHVPNRTDISFDVGTDAKTPPPSRKGGEPGALGGSLGGAVRLAESLVSLFVTREVAADEPLLGGAEPLDIGELINLVLVLLGNNARVHYQCERSLCVSNQYISKLIQFIISH